MKNEIICVFTLSVKEGQFSDFRNLVSEIVNETEKEPGTLTYMYSVSEDEKTAHIIEGYKTDALVSHVDVTFAPFAERFLSHVNVTGLTVYGKTDEHIRKRLDAFGAVYMTTFAGFTR
ncbi:antibiotic biosynthesis monooxygenase [Pectobacterium brasiliense]|uniref:putative quinol monooxygenase n=1 Tax=Pectobacterium brasiliense TaxID=180957 RepID=UPI00301969D8